MKKYIIQIGIFFIIAFLSLTPRFAKACDYSRGTITSVSPQTVSVGDVLTISGNGFGTIRDFRTGNSPSEIMYDKEVYFFWSNSGTPNERHSGGSFGGGMNGGISNYISWNDSEIKIRIPNNFEQIGGVVNALDENINEFHVYIVSYSFRISGSLPGGINVYSLDGTNNFELCGSPSYGTNSTFRYQPSCSADIWSCGEYQACTVGNQQTRTCTKTLNCPLVDTPSPSTTQICTYVAPTCTSWTYSDWSICSVNGQQTRSIISALPAGCTGGNPILNQSCTPIPPQVPPRIISVTPNPITPRGTEVEIVGENFGNQDIYKGRLYAGELGSSHQILSWTNARIKAILNLSDWNRVTNTTLLYIKVKCLDTDCSNYPNSEGPYGRDYVSNTFSIRIEQAASPPSTPPPALPSITCTEDIWSCGEYNQCSVNGTQSRTCRKTFDCPAVETAPPSTSQYCASPSNPPRQQENNQQDSASLDTNIIRATVKLICPIDRNTASQGSGTIIDSSGLVLTNNHVIEGTPGCIVGIINSAEDEPDFSARFVALPVKRSQNAGLDVALLKILNYNLSQRIDISNSNVNNLRLGDRLRILGYPDYAGSGGSNLTYTSGDFSGFGSRADGLNNYIKTSAPIEHGNSGGGAYTTNGLFVGIPTAVLRGELNSQGLILSVNKIKEWINSSSSSYTNFTGNRTPVSSMIDFNNIRQLNAETIDLNNVRVIIYATSSKRQTLTNTPNTRQTKNKPTFSITGLQNQDIEGYYVYFGTNINANPGTEGQYIRRTEFSPRRISRKGIYYFIFKAKNASDDISEPYITEYRYKK